MGDKMNKRMLKCVVLGMTVFCSLAVQSMEQCRVNYPVVLTHHWGIKALCQSAPDEACDRLVPAKYCQQWQWDEEGQDQDCLSWRVPENELDLPPRNDNLFEPSLQRDVSGYYRYFSQDIVQRLSQECGNHVFIADNPAFSSSLVRAQSLRNTVLQALDSTGADKVIVIGMSQGSQDARLLTQLTVDNGELITSDGAIKPTNVAMMASKVAAVVSIVGEDKGSWSASLFLNTMYVQRYASRDWQWQDYKHNIIWQLGKNKLMSGLWQNEEHEYVLSENQLEAQTEADIFQQFLASNIVLTKKYMTGEAYSWVNWEQSWDELTRAADLNDRNWNRVSPLSKEQMNSIAYYSYAAEVHGWNNDWGQSHFIAGLVELLEGKHDGYATVESQTLSKGKQHEKTMSGSPQGSGYHHMFFSGRNDQLYGPLESEQERGLYRGSSADFYQQIMINLVVAGF